MKNIQICHSKKKTEKFFIVLSLLMKCDVLTHLFTLLESTTSSDSSGGTFHRQCNGIIIILTRNMILISHISHSLRFFKFFLPCENYRFISQNTFCTRELFLSSAFIFPSYVHMRHKTGKKKKIENWKLHFRDRVCEWKKLWNVKFNFVCKLSL